MNKIHLTFYQIFIYRYFKTVLNNRVGIKIITEIHKSNFYGVLIIPLRLLKCRP